MPRLPRKLLQRAQSLHPLLPQLLQATRDLHAAQNELRWLRQHVIAQAQISNRAGPGWRRSLEQICLARGRGKPLQYLLGTEYFGDLEIICKHGVLIPRQETAASVIHLVQRIAPLHSVPEQLRVLDLCTGTGCIPLLFHHEISKKYPKAEPPQSVGVDLSPKAIRLARKNLARQKGYSGTVSTSLSSLKFLRGNVFARPGISNAHSGLALSNVLQSSFDPQQRSRCDILISNPPYISPIEFSRTTSRSVRNFEPKLALVPEIQHHQSGVDPGDVFYPRLLEVADELEAKVILFEVADLEQAKRVASMMAQRQTYPNIEIWRDDPASQGDSEAFTSHDTDVKILGDGNGRSVFAWRGKANQWILPAI